MRVMIAGAGIGGLAFALALDQLGIEFLIFDAASELKPMGVGINVLPHAAGELAEFGILQDLETVSVRTRELRYINKFGQLIFKEPRGQYAGHQLPQLSIHRGKLHGVMLDAIKARRGEQVIKTGHRFESFSQTEDRVVARFRCQDGSLVEQAGDVLAGADGIHSGVRARLHPSDVGMRWNGIMMWRGTVEWPEFDGGDTMIVSCRRHERKASLLSDLQGKQARHDANELGALQPARSRPARSRFGDPRRRKRAGRAVVSSRMFFRLHATSKSRVSTSFRWSRRRRRF